MSPFYEGEIPLKFHSGFTDFTLKLYRHGEISCHLYIVLDMVKYPVSYHLPKGT